MLTLDKEQQLALAKAGRCQCQACGKLALFAEAVVVAQQNQVMAAFCFDCFTPGRGFAIHRTTDGITVRALGEDAPASRIIVPTTAVPFFAKD